MIRIQPADGTSEYWVDEDHLYDELRESMELFHKKGEAFTMAIYHNEKSERIVLEMSITPSKSVEFQRGASGFQLTHAAQVRDHVSELLGKEMGQRVWEELSPSATDFRAYAPRKKRKKVVSRR